MPFSDYSTTAASNTTIGGQNVAEGCPPGNINNAVRQLMADGKALANDVAGLSGSMPTTGGTFTGDIVRSGRGGYLHHNGAAQTGGRIIMLPEGSATPSLNEGDIVFFYV